MENKIKIVMSEVFGVSVDNIDENTSSENVENWDSMSHMNLIVSLEEEFGIDFPFESIGEAQSFKKLITIITKLI